jgi:hypothetical protein
VRWRRRFASPLAGKGHVVSSDDKPEISVRALVRSLPSVALWMLLGCVGFWALLVWRSPSHPPLWAVLLAWPVVTVWIGPLFWVRHLPRRAASRWTAGATAALAWALVVLPGDGPGRPMIGPLTPSP